MLKVGRMQCTRRERVRVACFTMHAKRIRVRKHVSKLARKTSKNWNEYWKNQKRL